MAFSQILCRVQPNMTAQVTPTIETSREVLEWSRIFPGMVVLITGTVIVFASAYCVWRYIIRPAMQFERDRHKDE